MPNIWLGSERGLALWIQDWADALNAALEAEANKHPYLGFLFI